MTVDGRVAHRRARPDAAFVDPGSQAHDVLLGHVTPAS
jgi:hypothetical protein